MNTAPLTPSLAASPVFARVALLLYALLIAYASWYPFTGWRSNGLAPTAYLSAPLPHYWTKFDVTTNILGYIPLGLLLVFALYPKVRGGWAILLAVMAGTLLSGVMEAGQTYLPSRTSSNLDLLTNAAGAAIGALCGGPLSRTFLEQGSILGLRRKWFSPEASRGLIVLALWPLAQLYPQGYLFGHGNLTPILSEGLSSWLSMPIDLPALLTRDAELMVEQYWLAETIVTACGLTGALLTLLCLLRRGTPRIVPVAMLVTAACAAKSLSSALLFTPDNAFAWLTPGAQGGILIGAMMLSGLAFAPAVAQRRVAILALVASLITVNAIPVNPYFIATLQTWVQGKFLHFNGAAQFLSLLWPFLTLWFLLHPVHRSNK
jgi:VanZ family protein